MQELYKNSSRFTWVHLSGHGGAQPHCHTRDYLQKRPPKCWNFRLKQTMERRKLRSVSPANAKVELDWQMVGLWMLGLMTCDARRGSARTLSDWSPAQALRAVRMAMQRPNAPSSRWALRNRLRKAVKDDYQRRGPKAARNWPHKKTERPPGHPKTRMATKSEKLQAQRQKQCKPTN